MLKLNRCLNWPDDVGEGKTGRNVTDELFHAILNFDGFGDVEFAGHRFEEIDSGASKNGAYSSDSEAESSAMDCAVVGELANTPRRFRSNSMDGLTGRRNFPDELVRVSPSLVSKRSQSFQNDSMDGTFSLDFANGEFSSAELRKIMSDKRLEEIAIADPKRAKRVLANRQSAARSKERKTRYILELERRVQTLQTEATTLSAELTLLQRDSSVFATQNHELKIKLQSMEQQARLRDALNEALTAEVQRLRIASVRLNGSHSQHMKSSN